MSENDVIVMFFGVRTKYDQRLRNSEVTVTLHVWLGTSKTYLTDVILLGTYDCHTILFLSVMPCPDSHYGDQPGVSENRIINSRT